MRYLNTSHVISFWCVTAVLLLAPTTTCAQEEDASADEQITRGNQLLEEGDISLARDVFAGVVNGNEGPTDALIGLGRIALQEEDWNTAGDWFNRALSQDPENIDAYYFRGIVHRELAKYKTIKQVHHWNSSESDFERVLEADSLHRDVLYQYALLRRYHEEYPEAILLNQLQIKLRPELVEPKHEQFRFYRYFINHVDKQIALDWLADPPSDYGDFTIAELHRKEGALDEADALLSRLQGRTLSYPRQPILLSRARVFYAKGFPERAQRLIEQAIDEISSPLDALFIFDDIKYIIKENELELYRRLRTADEYKAYFKSFWARRDPLPASGVNVRMTEHYRRLLKAEKDYAYDGFRLWHDNPDKRGELVFPVAYDLNQEFNDKGLIYIRHGEPVDRESYVGDDNMIGTQSLDADQYWSPVEYSYKSPWTPNESWRYNNPRMDFHFVISESGGGNNWRLTPQLTNLGMIENLEHWGTPYAEMVLAIRSLESIQAAKTESPSQIIVSSSDEEILLEQADSLRENNRSDVTSTLSSEHSRHFRDFSDLQRIMVDRSRESIELGLNTDRHTWSEDVVEMPMPYTIAAFRGNEGTTRVEFHFALPIGKITEVVGPKPGMLDFELGYAIHDTAWTPVEEETEKKALPTSPDLTAAVIDFFVTSVRPDSYQVSLFGRPVATKHVGGSKFQYAVPDYSKPGLAMSDLLLANEIRPVSLPSRFDRGNLHVSPNPFNRFSNQQPVYVYFEIYDLTFNSDDHTEFTVEYALIPEQKKRKLLGLLGGSDQAALTLTVQRSGLEASPVEYAEFDVSDVDPGRYLLRVKITDKQTGISTERSRPIELYHFK